MNEKHQPSLHPPSRPSDWAKEMAEYFGKMTEEEAQRVLDLLAAKDSEGGSPEGNPDRTLVRVLLGVIVIQALAIMAQATGEIPLLG